MAVNKRSKNSRQRGSHTHGWGSMKKHRGSGNSGGAGNSGTGKRADSNKPSIWKDKKYFGKYGFKSVSRSKLIGINLARIEENLGQLIEKKLAKEESGAYAIDLKNLGYGKLLSKGKVTKKFIITCKAASARAKKSVEGAGGKLILPKKEDVNGTEGHTAKSS